ncbi:MAG: hypothetical protein AB1646_09465 [Thermodesulfobacteriota bacterium]
MGASNPTDPEDSGAAALRDLVVRQLMLHEVRHHPPVAEGEEHVGATVPIAHALADMYKCLHQGEFGVGHSIRNALEFGNQLAFELLRTDAAPHLPAVESVSSDRTVFRINLAPYRAHFDGDDSTACAQLLRVCLQSASRPRGDRERFLATLDLFRDLNSGSAFPSGGRVFAFDLEAVEGFLAEVGHFIETYGSLPVLSHSPRYKELNSPAYRVVDLASLADSPLAFLLDQSA